MADRRLTRIHSVREHLGDSLSAHTNELVAIFSRLVNQGKGMLQPHQIIAEFEAVIPEGERKKLEGRAFEEVLRAAQPAFYEAFRLTVVEAMTCDLPTFATAHGGPTEVIVDGVSGYHIDLYQGDKAAELLVSFFEKCKGELDTQNFDKFEEMLFFKGFEFCGLHIQEL